jgi:excinuclease ABC subunit A
VFSEGKKIELEGVCTHNLKDVDVAIPHGALTVISGVSGSGKSSLAYDTLYAEGQRRFVESLSTYARQFLRRMERPPIRQVRNLLPAVALRQKNTINNARSTVASLTEIGEHLALVYTHVGETRCPDCAEVVRRDTAGSVSDWLGSQVPGTQVLVIADVSSSPGRSSAQVLEEIAADGYRRILVESEVVRLDEVGSRPELLDRDCFSVVVDRLTVRADEDLRYVEAAEAGFRLGGGWLTLVVDGVGTRFSESFSCNSCRRAFTPPVPALFSSNTSLGACGTCTGFGRIAGLDMGKVVPVPALSLEGGAVTVFESSSASQKRRRTRMIRAARSAGVATDVPFQALPKEDQRFILEGGKGWGGVRGYFDQLGRKRYRAGARMMLARYRGYTVCPDCDGVRFSDEARSVSVAGRSFPEFLALSIDEARDAFRRLAGEDVESDVCDALAPAARARVAPLLDELIHRTSYLVAVGLGYLRFSRQSRTLSGGEVQRIHLTSSLGRMLSDTLYVLDEPTAGLHGRDTLRLLAVLHRLRSIGNAVVVVEHDPDIIRGADWVVELGPAGGEAGGELVFAGTVEALESAETATGEALRGRRWAYPRADYIFDPTLHAHVGVVGAQVNNLRDITARIPLGRMTCITGVSGSGKTSLIHHCLHDSFRRGGGGGGPRGELVGFDLVSDVVLMRQGGLGRSSRSNVATYTKAWDGVRKLFGGLRDARAKGLGPGAFSFNVPGGRCEACEGTGTLVVEMHFMADIEVLCEVCEGRRFGERVLSVAYRGKSVHDVLQLTVTQAMDLFAGSRAITNRIAALNEVGLGYLRLGQTTSTLSGGEAQRLMLARYIGGRDVSGGGVVFLFDEPTVGLHLRDIDVLLSAFRTVIAEGHTVVCVEHNIDLIARADHVIDLGPDGGDGGGAIVVEGPPHRIAEHPDSWTGRFLSEVLTP